MQERMGGDDCEGCSDIEHLRQEYERLRIDLEDKHKQNRLDIHKIRNDQQRMLLDMAKLEGSVKPLLDNGQPGLISKILTELRTVANSVTDLRIALGVTTTENKTRWTDSESVKTAIITIAVAVIMIIANHFWK